MMNKILKIIAVAQAVAFPSITIEKANDSRPTKGSEIIEGQYYSEVLVGDIAHAYIVPGCHNLGTFSAGDKSFLFGICINENGTVEEAYIDGANNGLVDWEKSGLSYNGEWRYIFDKSYFCIYFTRPLKATHISDWTKQYLTDPTIREGYEIFEGQYCSEVLVGDIAHAYIDPGCHNLGTFSAGDKSFLFGICINENGTVEEAYIDGANNGLVDWEKSGLSYNGEWRYIFDKSYFCIYFTRPLKATHISDWTKQYLSYTSPARTFAAGYDGFLPSYYYTSISGNGRYLQEITSTSSLITGTIWKSGDVSNLNIEKNGFIIQNYYVYASVEEADSIYIARLGAFAKSKDGNKVVDLNVVELVRVELNQNKRIFSSYEFPKPVATLETKTGYYNIIRSSGAYGITESVMNYQEGYKAGQENPTFKSFIVSAFEACSAFFSLPVLGEHITIGTLIGSFVGLGALFLIIRLFR